MGLLSVFFKQDDSGLRTLQGKGQDVEGRDHDGDNIKNAMDMDGIVGGDNNGNDLTPTSPICTKKASYRPRPDDVSTAQYERVRQAEDVTFYIVEELNKIGVPVTIMYGSMLHEYRNGTSPCIQADFKDKDLDIAVFAQHFPHVLAMTGKIQKKFGWRVERVNEELMIVVLLPPNQREAQYGFQIDIYGFDCKYTNNKELIYFPWDKVAVNMNQFLPLVKHKTPVYNDRSAAVTGGRQPPTQDKERLYMHTPFSPPCLLANMYGADFMTPHEGKSKQDAHDESTQECMNQMLTSAQHKELQRQLSLCTW
jgi:hypothetical protein